MNKNLNQFQANINSWIANLKQSLSEAFSKLDDMEGNNYKLGLMHLEKGNISDAVFRFTIITKINPKNVNAWLSLAKARSLQNEKEKAEFALNKAKALGASAEETAEI